MASTADKIMKRILAHKKGEWVCTPWDFTDLGGRAAIDQALSRLVKAGKLNRLSRGYYFLPRYYERLRLFGPAPPEAVVAALERRFGCRIMMHGLEAANALHLTTCVPCSLYYATDGPSRQVVVGGWTITLVHTKAGVMRWAGRPGEPVVQALLWLGERIAPNCRGLKSLPKILPDYVKADLDKGRRHLPGWTLPYIDKLVEQQGDGE